MASWPGFSGTFTEIHYTMEKLKIGKTIHIPPTVILNITEHLF
jgi:predicted Rossmann-fold nucleotide-binding protein